MKILNLEDAPYYRVKQVKGHKCKLNYEANSVSYHIKSGFFVSLRRFFKQSTMISTRDPRTKAYFKSICLIMREEKKHLERHYYMIHPFSDFHFLWQTIMTITHLLALSVIPAYYLTKTENTATHIASLSRSIYLICFLNIFLSFFIGFYDKSKERVILQQKRVIIRYLITYFLFDLLSSVNYNFFAILTRLYNKNWYTRFQWSLKLVRIFTINEYLDNLQLIITRQVSCRHCLHDSTRSTIYYSHKRLDLPNYIYRGVKFLIFGTVSFLWLNYLSYALDIYFKREVVKMDLLHKVSLVMNKTFRGLYLCDLFKGYYEVIYGIDLYVAVTILQFGKVFEIWLLAQFFKIFGSYTVVTQKHQTLWYQVKAFTRFKDLPKRICRRIYSYLNFRFECLVINEEDILNDLCVTVKDEILSHKCQFLVNKVQTFAQLPTPIMLKLATMLKPEIYLPNDVVIHTGEVGREMFFVYVGVLAVFTESGKEICHLSDGCHFGEIALLLNEPRIASVVAIDFCELYRLTKRNFHEAIEPYPLVRANIMKAAQDRFRETRIITQQ